jgi:hypothetical protein
VRTRRVTTFVVLLAGRCHLANISQLPTPTPAPIVTTDKSDYRTSIHVLHKPIMGSESWKLFANRRLLRGCASNEICPPLNRKSVWKFSPDPRSTIEQVGHIVIIRSSEVWQAMMLESKFIHARCRRRWAGFQIRRHTLICATMGGLTDA